MEASGDLAYARVKVTWKATAKAEGDTAKEILKALFIFRRQVDGGWRCSQHMWSGTEP